MDHYRCHVRLNGLQGRSWRWYLRERDGEMLEKPVGPDLVVENQRERHGGETPVGTLGVVDRRWWEFGGMSLPLITDWWLPNLVINYGSAQLGLSYIDGLTYSTAKVGGTKGICVIRYIKVLSR